MGYELTGKKASETYGTLVQCIDGSYYNGLGDILNLSSFDSSLSLKADLSYVDASLNSKLNTKNIGINVNGNSNVITPGSKGYREIDDDYTIDNWTLLSDVSGTISIDIKRCTYETWPINVSITGSEKPNLNNVTKNKNDTLFGWSIDISKGDILEFVIDNSVSFVTQIWLSLNLSK